MPRRVRRYNRHVQSGSWPLYRLIMVALLISSTLSLTISSTPDSVSALAGTAADGLYLSAALAGSALVLVGLYIQKAWLSLQLERLGAILVATNAAVYAVAVIYTYGMPTAAATWGSIALGIYCTYRALVEIPRDLAEIRELAREQYGEIEEVAHG